MVRLMLLSVTASLSFSFSARAQSSEVELIAAVRDACAGLSSVLAASERATIELENYELTIEGGNTLEVKEQGVLLRRIERFEFADYSACLKDLLSIMRDLAKDRASGRGSSSKVPVFRDTVTVTYWENEQFVDFLDANVGKLVFLDIVLDASVWGGADVVQEACPNFEWESIIDGELAGREIPLALIDTEPSEELDSEEDRQSAVENIDCNHVLRLETKRKQFNPSHGGTGVIQYTLKGAFLIERRVHGGPILIYDLEEKEVSAEFMSSVLN